MSLNVKKYNFMREKYKEKYKKYNIILHARIVNLRCVYVVFTLLINSSNTTIKIVPKKYITKYISSIKKKDLQW